MKTFQLTAEPRTVLGKKASKALRNDEKIPVVLNGGKIVDLPYAGTLEEGQKVVELCNNKGIITTDLTVKAEDVRKLVYSPDVFEIDLTFDGIVMLFSLSQPSNAQPPIFVTLAGIVMSVRAIQFRKASLPIDFTSSRKRIF